MCLSIRIFNQIFQYKMLGGLSDAVNTQLTALTGCLVFLCLYGITDSDKMLPLHHTYNVQAYIIAHLFLFLIS